MTVDKEITKPKRAIDYLPDDPFGALEKVWELEDVAHFIHGELTYWFYMALATAARYIMMRMRTSGLRSFNFILTYFLSSRHPFAIA